MKPHTNKLNTRDEVLYAFHAACERPSADEICEWVEQYPDFADDIRAHAAIAWDLDARENLPQEVPDELMLSRAQSRMLNALHNAAEAATHTQASESKKTFNEMMQARSTDIPTIARRLKVPRIVIGTVFRGGFVGAISKRFRDALSSFFGEPSEAIDAAVDDARMHPCLGLPKANGTPTGAPLSFDELVRSSGMSPEEIEYWLA